MFIIITCKNKEDPIKMKALECLQHVSHYKSMGILFRRSRTANSIVRGRIGWNFKLIREFKVAFLTKNTIKNEGARVLTRLYINFSDIQGQLIPQSMMESSRNSNLSKLFKNGGTRVLTTFLTL